MTIAAVTAGSPPISVIIPCHNMGRFLAEAVESVTAQGHPDVQIVVVDDGSSDDVAAHVRALPRPVDYIRQDNLGPAAARNRGIRAARHDVLAFVDADDVWPADKLRLQLPALLEDPARDLVLGHQRVFTLRAGAADGSRDYELHDPHFIFLVGCGLYRRRAFDRVGLFDETMRFSEDTDWFFRCREAGLEYRVLPEVTVLYRRHAGSMTHGLDAVGKGYLAAIKKSLDRRRRAQPGTT
jgi:glycosyltransferase involved in cell wall biosynthesis